MQQEASDLPSPQQPPPWMSNADTVDLLTPATPINTVTASQL